MPIEPRLNIVTLGVADVAKARRFYETGLGWKASSASQGDIVFFQLGAMESGAVPPRGSSRRRWRRAGGQRLRGHHACL